MLVPDWKTDCVAVVEPKAQWRYGPGVEAVYADFVEKIEAHDALKVLDDPDLDIWVRDFAPFQKEDARWVAGIYQPEYLTERESARISEAFARHCVFDRFPVRLDGGTFVHNGCGIGISTTELYRLNRDRSPEELRDLLKKHLELERLVVVLPAPGDKTGHVDGIVKWAEEETLLIARGEYDRVIAALRAGLPRGIEIVPFPEVRCEEIRRGWPTARGVYVNFLLTRNAVYLPIFDLPQDEEAVRAAERLFGGKPIVPIKANAVAARGGVLNCISWNFKSDL